MKTMNNTFKFLFVFLTVGFMFLVTQDAHATISTYCNRVGDQQVCNQYDDNKPYEVQTEYTTYYDDGSSKSNIYDN